MCIRLLGLLYSNAPAARKAMVNTNTITTSLMTYLSQRSYGIWATARPPMTTALVGVSRFTRPEALWNAVMINALEILVNSPKGTMMGMDNVASPELDGIKNDSGKYNRYVSRINRMELAPDSAISPQFKMVSVIKPEFMITVIPRDMAMINATPNRSDAPRTKPSMSSCSRIRVATPTIIPATRNSPDSSVKYQPSVGKKVMPKSLNGITE